MAKPKGMNWAAYGDLYYRVMQRANWHCEYCGVDLLESLHMSYTKQLDHLVPRCKDGPTDYENLVSSCFVCNAEKRCYVPTDATREEKLQDARDWLTLRVDNARRDYVELLKKVRGTTLAIDAIALHVPVVPNAPQEAESDAEETLRTGQDRRPLVLV